MELPLTGTRVVDMSQVLAGPYAASMLGDLGADVIKVEPPSGDTFRYADRVMGTWSAYFMAIHRNKRSIVLDPDREEDRRILDELIASADVFIVNMKPEALRRKNFTYEDIRALNESIVYCSITAFGETGPLADEPGMDILAQAIGGMMGVTGEPGRPPVKVGAPVSDFSACYLAVQGVLAALLGRQRTGEGAKVSVNLLDATLGMLANYVAQHFANGEEIVPVGGGHPQLVPYQVFLSSDEYFIVACLNQRFWELLCQVVDKEEWLTDERFANNHLRVQHRSELIPDLEKIFRARPAAEWISALRTAGVPASQVNRYSQAVRDPQVVHNRLLASVDHPDPTVGTYTTIVNPVLYDDERLPVRLPAPAPDHDREDILSELARLTGARRRSAGVGTT